MEIAPALHAQQFRLRNRNIQWLRAASALLVLVFHAAHYLGVETGDTRYTTVFTGEFGILAVATFFAISGALMADLVKTTPPVLFLVHRIIRIYPLAAILAIALPFLLVTGRFSLDMRALSLVPIGTSGNYRLSVEWTLVFELFYYVALFALAALGFARRVEAFALGWLTIIVASVFLMPAQTQVTLTPTIAQIPFMAANAAFAGGLLVPWLLRRGVFQPAMAVVAFVAATLSITVELPEGRLLGAIAAVIFVGMAVAWEDRDLPENFATRIATRLGDWSYALYLCHVPVLLWTFRTIDAPPAVLLVLGVSAAVALSAPLGILDLRLYRILKRRCDRADGRTLQRWIVGYLVVYAILAVVFLFKD